MYHFLAAFLSERREWERWDRERSEDSRRAIWVFRWAILVVRMLDWRERSFFSISALERGMRTVKASWSNWGAGGDALFVGGLFWIFMS